MGGSVLAAFILLATVYVISERTRTRLEFVHDDAARSPFSPDDTSFPPDCAFVTKALDRASTREHALIAFPLDPVMGLDCLSRAARAEGFDDFIAEPVNAVLMWHQVPIRMTFTVR